MSKEPRFVAIAYLEMVKAKAYRDDLCNESRSALVNYPYSKNRRAIDLKYSSSIPNHDATNTTAKPFPVPQALGSACEKTRGFGGPGATQDLAIV